MLGVAAGLGAAGLNVSPPQSRSNPASSDVQDAIRERLAKAKNLSPEKREAIARALEERLGTRAKAMQVAADETPSKGRGTGCAVMLAALVLFMGVSGFLFLGASRESAKKLLELLPKKAPVVVPQVQIASPTPPASAVEEDVATDQVAIDKLDAPLVAAGAAPARAGQTLDRDQMRPMRACFHGRGVPTERPMSFGIELSHTDGTTKANIFAMTDVQVPPAVAKCIGRHAVFLHLTPGVYFVDWPLDDNWP
jgi:hypothetical protein